MFIYGGYSRGVLSDFFYLDTSTKVWGQIHLSGDIPRLRSYSSLFTFDEKVWLFGGRDSSNELHNDLHSFDPNQKTWKIMNITSGNDEIEPRCFHSMSVV